jgi:hypothetical protein
MRARGNKSHELMRLLLSAGAMMLTGVIGSVMLVEGMADVGPRVGDIISYPAGRELPDDVPGRIKVFRVERRVGTCVLDLRVLLRDGGSLVIEALERGAIPRYRLHWAGIRSSGDDTDCGPDADLLVGRIGVEALIIAAGGVGIGSKHLAAAYLLNGAAYSAE